MFTIESGLVVMWAGFVQGGVYTLDEVPSMSNLKPMVEERLEQQTSAT